jgi:signal transduction histidine kinase
MPIEIDSHGLCAALEELTERTGKTYDIECTFDCPTGVPETDSFAATHLYRIAREAVHNAVKHAKATRIWMRLTDDVYTMLTVRDDGVGMDVAGTSNGEGLRIMGHRANLIGATLSLENAEKGGTIVRCILNH